MVSRLKTLWHGEIPLWKVFWFPGIILLSLFSFAFITSQEIIATVAGQLSRTPLYLDYFLMLIFVLYGIFILIPVWRSAKKYRGLRMWSLLARLTIVLAVLWFSGNLALYLMLKTSIPPAIETMVNNTPEILKIAESNEKTDPLFAAERVSFKEISIKFPFSKENITEVVPIFVEHQLSEIVIKLGNGGYFMFESMPVIHFSQTKKSFIENIMEKVLLDQTLNNADSTDALNRIMQYSRLKDFSWWNVFYNIRLSIKLILKVIAIPGYGNNQRIYDLVTPNFTGFLRVGEGKSDKLILNLSFEWRDSHYSVICMNFEKNDLNKLIKILSTVLPMDNMEKSSHETEIYYKNRKEKRYPEELLLLSTMSFRGLSKDRLEELLKIMEQKHYRPNVTAWVRQEIDFLGN